MPIHHPLGFKQHPLEDAGIDMSTSFVDETCEGFLGALSLLCDQKFHLSLSSSHFL